MQPSSSKLMSSLAARGFGMVAGACFFTSGFLSLVYEVCWIRKAALVFGTVTFAMSTVLGVFFAGLAIGSFLFGKRAERCARPLRVYALLEFGVAALAFASPWLFELVEVFFHQSYPALADRFWALASLRLALLTAILLPPTILMGGTLPLFCQQFVRAGRISRSVGWLYGLNTLGAAIGCGLCGFVLIPQIGVNNCLWIAAVCNVLVGMVAWNLTSESLTRLPQEAAPSDAVRPRGMRRVRSLFLVTGFLALANEVLITRFLSLLVHNTVYTYTLTLVVILAGIFLGSFIAARYGDRWRQRGFIFGCLQIAIGLSALTVMFLPPAVWRYCLDASGTVAQLVAVSSILLIPAILSGISFPLGVCLVNSDPRATADHVGQLTALNTMGGILGSLLAGFVILPLLGLHVSILLTTAGSVIAGLLAWTLTSREFLPRRFWLQTAVIVAWIGIPMINATRLPADFLDQHGTLLDYREGLSAHVAVVQHGDIKRLEVDRLWQGEDRKTHQVMAAHLPMLLADDPQEVLVIGIGPGQTSSRFLLYPIRRLDCVDIEAELFPLVREYFASDWMEDPRTKLVVDDGRNFLAHTSRKYDLISIEVGQAFRPGVASFYTRDFYRQAHQRLTEKGVISQFVSLDFFTPQQMKTVLATFCSVFPECTLWYNRAELLLIGHKNGQARVDSDRLESLLERESIRKDLQFSYWGSNDLQLDQPPHLLASFLMGPAGVRRVAQGSPHYRDDRPYLEYDTRLVTMEERIESVRLLRGQLEPVSEISDYGTNSGKIARRQRRNLDDVVAQEWVWRANESLSMNDESHALRALRQAIRWNPDNYWANLMLADALVRAQDRTGALAFYKKALALRPGDDRAAIGMAGIQNGN